MNIKRLFESLTDDEKLELAHEIRALLKHKEPEPTLTKISKLYKAEFKYHGAGSSDKFADIVSVRLYNAIIGNADYFDEEGLYYETIRANDLRKIRGFGKRTIDEFLELRETWHIVY